MSSPRLWEISDLQTKSVLSFKAEVPQWTSFYVSFFLQIYMLEMEAFNPGITNTEQARRLAHGFPKMQSNNNWIEWFLEVW